MRNGEAVPPNNEQIPSRVQYKVQIHRTPRMTVQSLSLPAGPKVCTPRTQRRNTDLSMRHSEHTSPPLIRTINALSITAADYSNYGIECMLTDCLFLPAGTRNRVPRDRKKRVPFVRTRLSTEGLVYPCVTVIKQIPYPQPRRSEPIDKRGTRKGACKSTRSRVRYRGVFGSVTGSIQGREYMRVSSGCDVETGCTA